MDSNEKVIREKSDETEKFQVLQLVWSRLKGFPYWPSVLLDSKTDLKQKLKNRKSVTNKYEFISYWLDSGKISYIQSKNVVEFFSHFQQNYDPNKKLGRDSYIKAVDRALTIAIEFYGLKTNLYDLKMSLMNDEFVVEPIVFESMEAFKKAIKNFNKEDIVENDCHLKPCKKKFLSVSNSSEPKIGHLLVKFSCECCQMKFETGQNSINFVDCMKCIAINIGPNLPPEIFENDEKFISSSASSKPESYKMSTENEQISEQNEFEFQTTCLSDEISVMQYPSPSSVVKISSTDLNFNTIFPSRTIGKRYESFRLAKKSVSTDDIFDPKMLSSFSLVQSKDAIVDGFSMTCESTALEELKDCYIDSQADGPSVEQSEIIPKETVFRCSFCPKWTINSTDLESHMKHHLSKFSLKCVHCNYSTEFHSDLVAHTVCHFEILSSSTMLPIKQETVERRKVALNLFQCTFCGRKFDSSENLRCHEALHLFS